jgi:hypothetical protein
MKSKSNQVTDKDKDNHVQEFMPLWKLEEECFKPAIITDPDTKKKTGDTFPRTIPPNQRAYENWKERVSLSGEYYKERDSEGVPVKDSKGARYVVKVIVRVRAADKKEFLYSKGNLIGYNAAGEIEPLWIIGPETYRKTNFSWKRVINEKTMTFEKQLEGVHSVVEIFDLPFNKDNLKKLYDKREGDMVHFVVKDQMTDKAYSVVDMTGNPSKTYELFRDSDFDYLFNADYQPAIVKSEARQQAVAEGLIGGTIADYSTTKVPKTRTTEYLA